MRPEASILNLAGMLGLFFWECDFLLRVPEHEEVRQLLRVLIGAPAHDILFVACGLLALFNLALGRSVVPAPDPFCPRFLILHLAATVGMEYLLVAFHAWTLTHPLAYFLWFLLLPGYALTWLACVLRPSRWIPSLYQSWRWVLGALLVSGVAVGQAKSMADSWYGLASTTFKLSECWLQLFVSDVVTEPEAYRIGSGDFVISIGAPFSGYEGIALLVCYLSCYLGIRREALRFPTALPILPIGILCSWFLNTWRIALLVLLGARLSPKLALGAFHSAAGWLAFVLLAVMFVGLLEKTRWFHKAPHRITSSPARPYLAPLLMLFALQLATSTVTDDFDYYYPLRVVLVGGLLFFYRGFYRELFRYERLLQAIASGIGVYLLWLALCSSEQVAPPSSYLEGELLLAWLLFRVVGAVVVVPLVEELAFRGFLMRRLERREFEKVALGAAKPLAILISSLAFGALHANWAAGILAGICYALLLRGGVSLTPAVVSHSVTNLCISMHVLAFEARWRW